MSKESLLASMPKLILAVVLIVCIGAVMGLMGYALTRKATVNNYQRIKISNEDIKKETTNWQVYEYEDWGFSMKIPPVYTKKEKNVEAGDLKLDSIIFSKGYENVSIIIDQSKDIDSLRMAVIEAFNKFESGKEKEVLKFLNELKLSNSEIIDFNKAEIKNCIGMRFVEKNNNNKYIHNIVLVSLDKKDINIQISFKYYNEDTKLEIAEMIETIKCADTNDIADWQTYRNEEYGFEVKYPEYRKEIDKTPAIMSFAYKGNENNLIQIRSIDRENDISLMEQIKRKGDIEPELVKINNKDFYFLKVSMAGLIFYEYYVENKNEIFIISMVDMSTNLLKNAQDESDITYPIDEELSEELNILRIMVSTFKFIEN